MLFLSTLSKLTMSSLNKTVSFQQEHTGIQIKGAQQVKFQYSCIINLNLHHYALGLGRVSANGCTRSSHFSSAALLLLFSLSNET